MKQRTRVGLNNRKADVSIHHLLVLASKLSQLLSACLSLMWPLGGVGCSPCIINTAHWLQLEGFSSLHKSLTAYDYYPDNSFASPFVQFPSYDWGLVLNFTLWRSDAIFSFGFVSVIKFMLLSYTTYWVMVYYTIGSVYLRMKPKDVFTPTSFGSKLQNIMASHN